jgi:hypothetical protein
LNDGDQPTYVGSDAEYRSGWFAAGGGLFGGLLLGGFGGWISDDGATETEPTDGSSMDW